VYAWRRGRARRIGRSTDVLLALFPFEEPFYERTPVKVVYVGHPMADAISLDAGSHVHRMEARDRLGIVVDGPLFAILPGSRSSEVDLLLEDFLQTAQLIQAERPKAAFVIPCLHEHIAEKVRARLDAMPDLRAMCYHGDARLGLTACNAALVKSGTSTLEAMLLKRPMVVSYRLGHLSYQIASRLLRTNYVALPNILAGRALVPELLQYDATPKALARNLLAELDKAGAQAEYLSVFEHLHQQLRCNADERAADAVDQLLQETDGAL
jgi:lipid-A-disaccharide synthase